MADTALIQFRVDKDLKQEVSDICEALGTDLPTVFRMCMKQMKMSRGIPFPTRLSEDVVTKSEALEAFEQLRMEAMNTPEMSLNEINGEIEAARAERKARRSAVV